MSTDRPSWLSRIFGRGRPAIPVVRLSGVIGMNSPLRRTLTLDSAAKSLDTAFGLKSAPAVALIINSPGGSPVQSSLVGKRIRQHAQERKVPVIAFVEDVAASGGYWLAASADEIIADPSSILGSIGVVSAGFGLDEAISRIGVKRRLYTQGDHKRMLDPFLPERPEEVERLKALQADMHATFKDWVRERRGDRLKGEDATLFNGDILTGTRALDLGLVDGLGDIRSTLRARHGETVRIRVVGERRGWLRRRMGMDDPGSWLAAVEERLAWARWGL
jgi:signal peptide peptidase SppA